LLLRADAEDAAGLQRIQDLISGDLERWGKRENLKVTWRGPDAIAAPSAAPNSPDNPISPTERAHSAGARASQDRLKLAAAGALGIALIVIVHLTLAGAATVFPLWLGWTAAGVLLTPAIVVVLHAIGPFLVLFATRSRELRHTICPYPRRPA
jgi:hypothetical protein